MQAQQKACYSNRPESSTLRQHLTGPTGVEYLVQEKNGRPADDK